MNSAVRCFLSGVLMKALSALKPDQTRFGEHLWYSGWNTTDESHVMFFFSGTGRVPDQLVNLDMKHGVEAKNYEEVRLS